MALILDIKKNNNYIKKTCPTCNGQKKLSEMGIETCNHCCGTGRDLHSDVWAEPCIHCNGKGKKTYCRSHTCDTCNGLGFIFY